MHNILYMAFVIMSPQKKNEGILKEAHDLFFSLSSQEKYKVLSCMFKSLGEENVSKNSDVDIKTEIFILRAFTLIDKSTGAEIPLTDG